MIQKVIMIQKCSKSDLSESMIVLAPAAGGPETCSTSPSGGRCAQPLLRSPGDPPVSTRPF